MIYDFEDLELRPISVGRFTHKDGFFDVKARPYASISFRICGKGSFEVEGEHLESEAGDVLFIPSGTPYRVDYSCSESIVVHMQGCSYVHAESISLQNAASIEGCFCRLLDAWNERHSVNRAKSMIYDILNRMAEDRTSGMRDTAFAACVAYLEAHFCDPELTVAEVCAAGFLSAASLQRKFHEHFHLSPKQYLTRLRMNRAMELLIACELSIREIAQACGFSDEKYFSRAFRNQYGYPPSQMQKNILV